MNLLLLSGNSINNKTWVHEVKNHLAPSFKSSLVHHYSHWESGEPFIDFDYETKQVVDEVRNFEPYAIFAKSVGTVLATQAIARRLINPEWCVFTGLPLKLIIREQLPVLRWLKDINIPILIAQNDNDPVGTFEEVKNYISEVKNSQISIVCLEGDNHNYDDLDKIKNIVLSFIKF